MAPKRPHNSADAGSKRRATDPASGDEGASRKSSQSARSRNVDLYETPPDPTSVAGYLKAYNELAGHEYENGVFHDGLLKIEGEYRLQTFLGKLPTLDEERGMKRLQYYKATLAYDQYKQKRTMLLFFMGLSPQYTKAALQSRPNDGPYGEAKRLLADLDRKGAKSTLKHAIDNVKDGADEGYETLPSVMELYRIFQVVPRENAERVLSATVQRLFMSDAPLVDWKYRNVRNAGINNVAKAIGKFHDVKDKYVKDFTTLQELSLLTGVAINAETMSELNAKAQLVIETGRRS